MCKINSEYKVFLCRCVLCISLFFFKDNQKTVNIVLKLTPTCGTFYNDQNELTQGAWLILSSSLILLWAVEYPYFFSGRGTGLCTVLWRLQIPKWYTFALEISSGSTRAAGHFWTGRRKEASPSYTTMRISGLLTGLREPQPAEAW